MTRYKIVLTVFFIVWLVLLVRVFQISVGHGKYYETLANKNMVKKEWILPIRGEILDRNEEPLAINKIGFSINIAPHLDDERLQKVIEKITSRFALEAKKIAMRYKQKNSYYNHDFIEVKSFISYDAMLPHISVLEREENIKINPSTLRYYPHGDATAHILGYVGKYGGKVDDEVAKITQIIGKNGLEKQYNDYLQGELGYKLIKVTASNEQIETLEYQKPVENRSLQITVDSRLQEYIHELFKDKAGAAVVMKTNGELLASVSYPSYDPNMFVTGISQKQWDEIRFDFDHPFTNKFINGMYPPGSVIKMGVGLAMFDAGDINEHTTTYCTSNFKINDYPFRCWKEEGHGKTDFNKAIRESCDDYFYKNSIKTGINKIAQVLRSVGLGEKTGVDLPNESYGTIPDIPWKHRRYNQRWYMGDTVNSSIGQGYMLVTPLQIAKHTAFLATDALPKPSYVINKENNTTVVQSEMAERNPRAMEAIRKAMREVAAHHKGTAYWYTRRSKVDIAAKTGTAQVVSIPQDEKERMKESELEYYHRSHAWLTSYGPYDDPQVVVTVMVEHGGHGGQAAGPMVSKIYNWLLKQGYITQ